MFYETLTKLCAQKGTSLTNLLSDELHMSTGNITNWKKGILPKSNTLAKLADYFDVSTDYLLGNGQKNKPSAEAKGLSEKEKQLLKAFRNMTDDAQDSFLNIAAAASAKIDREERK